MNSLSRVIETFCFGSIVTWASHLSLLGGHATIGDFGLFNALYAHLARDPHPALLMKKIAPRVYAWVERMNGPEEFQDHTVNRQGSELFSHDDVPESLLDMMRYVRDEYLPEITAHVEFTNSWLLARPEIEPGTPCAVPLGANENPGGSLDVPGLTTEVWILKRW